MAEIIDAYCTLGTQHDTVLDADRLLEQMDQTGVDRAVIVPEDREIVIDNAGGNQRMLDAARAADGRFIPACSVNPWRQAEACQLLTAAVHNGAKMLVLAPMLQGFNPTDELTEPLLELAGQLRVPVYIHTGPHSSGAPSQVVLLAERFGQTRFILGHCGSTDFVWDMPAILEHHRLPNVWYELSLVRPWIVGRYLELAGPTRLIYGSSAPRNDPVFELAQFTNYLPAQDYPQVYGGNLATLLAEVRHDC